MWDFILIDLTFHYYLLLLSHYSNSPQLGVIIFPAQFPQVVCNCDNVPSLYSWLPKIDSGEDQQRMRMF